MTPEEQARFLLELGKISSAIARVETKGEERHASSTQRFRAVDARLAKLETADENTGRHDLASLEKALDKREADLRNWRNWALGIAGALITSAIVGLVVYWATTR